MSTRNQKGRLSRKRTVTTFYHWNTYNLKFLGDSLPFLIFWRTTIHQPPQSILAAILKCLVTSLLTEHMKENWEQEHRKIRKAEVRKIQFLTVKGRQFCEWSQWSSLQHNRSVMTKTASVSDRVIARKLEQQQKRMGEGGGGRGGEGRGKSYFLGRSHDLKYICVRRLRVFTIYKNFPKNPVGTVDETRLFGSFHWKISGSNGKGNPVFPDGMFQMEIRVLFL